MDQPPKGTFIGEAFLRVAGCAVVLATAYLLVDHQFDMGWIESIHQKISTPSS